MDQTDTTTAWTAKSARIRRLTLLGTLAALVIAALTGCAAGGTADFTVSATPAAQTVVAGQAVTFDVRLARQNGHAATVNLKASGLPTGAKASFAPGVLRSTAAASAVTITTSTATPTGTSTVTITAADGQRSRTATVMLTVAAVQPAFTIGLSPATRTIAQGDNASYRVKLNRERGFTGTVALSVSGLPAGASAKLTPATVPVGSSSATLDVTTTDKVKAGSYRFTVMGSAGGQSRTAAATLTVEQTKAFTITGDAPGALTPGTSVALSPTVSNPYHFGIRITALSVAVDPATSHPGCSGAQDFAVTQVAASSLPVTVPADATRSLRDLIPAPALPRLEMLDRPTNQDACKGAAISLHYAGTATK